MTEPALILENVVKRDGRSVVLDGASVAFHFGELAVIRCKRGRAKSAIARLLSGAGHPDSGRMRRAGLPAPLVGASAGFQSGAPVLRGLELRAAAYGLDLRSFRAKIAALLDDPATLEKDFGRLGGVERQAVLYGASYYVPAPIYVIEGSPLPTDGPLRGKVRKRFVELRQTAALIWLTEEKTALAAWKPERSFGLAHGTLTPVVDTAEAAGAR